MTEPWACGKCKYGLADVHLNQFTRRPDGGTCENCHKTAGWADLLFSHSRDAQFALDGVHEKVAFRGYHKPMHINGYSTILYRPLGTRCVNCHQQMEKAAQR